MPTAVQQHTGIQSGTTCGPVAVATETAYKRASITRAAHRDAHNMVRSEMVEEEGG